MSSSLWSTSDLRPQFRLAFFAPCDISDSHAQVERDDCKTTDSRPKPLPPKTSFRTGPSLSKYQRFQSHAGQQRFDPACKAKLRSVFLLAQVQFGCSPDVTALRYCNPASAERKPSRHSW